MVLLLLGGQIPGSQSIPGWEDKRNAFPPCIAVGCYLEEVISLRQKELKKLLKSSAVYEIRTWKKNQRNANKELNDTLHDMMLDDIPCEICSNKDSTDEDQIILCSICKIGAAHMKCLTPALSAVPEDNWLCQRCIKAGLHNRIGNKPVREPNYTPTGPKKEALLQALGRASSCVAADAHDADRHSGSATASSSSRTTAAIALDRSKSSKGCTSSRAGLGFKDGVAPRALPPPTIILFGNPSYHQARAYRPAGGHDYQSPSLRWHSNCDHWNCKDCDSSSGVHSDMPRECYHDDLFSPCDGRSHDISPTHRNGTGDDNRYASSSSMAHVVRPYGGSMSASSSSGSYSHPLAQCPPEHVPSHPTNSQPATQRRRTTDGMVATPNGFPVSPVRHHKQNNGGASTRSISTTLPFPAAVGEHTPHDDMPINEATMAFINDIATVDSSLLAWNAANDIFDGLATAAIDPDETEYTHLGTGGEANRPDRPSSCTNINSNRHEATSGTSRWDSSSRSMNEERTTSTLHMSTSGTSPTTKNRISRSRSGDSGVVDNEPGASSAQDSSSSSDLTDCTSHVVVSNSSLDTEHCTFVASNHKHKRNRGEHMPTRNQQQNRR